MPLGLYGDLAVGDAPHAGDVWARPELYARGVSIGAPPDAYSASGQAWGITPLHPLALRKDRYRRWSALLRHAFAHSGVLRIDHVMGLARQFWVPDGATAREGGYVRYPLDDLLGIVALESRRAGALVVGEDLGVVPDGFRERMAHSAVLRSQVMYFERDGDGGFRAPLDYARNALISASTHDLPPVAGFWAGTDLDARRRGGNIESDDALARELIEREQAKAALLAMLRSEGLLAHEPEEPNMQDLVAAVNQLLASTASRLVGVALDDLTLERDALNIPATVLPDHPNWSRKSRIGLGALAESQPIADQIRRIRERARIA
jgi:4-alpha-glucanotransferase